MSASKPEQPDEPSSKADSAPGPASARPTFTTRLRDLLAVSSWRISQGEAGRLTDVKDDVASHTTASRLQEALGHDGPPTATAQVNTDRSATVAEPAAEPAVAAAGGVPGAPAEPKQQEQQTQQQQQEQQTQQRLLHPKYGYAALGGVLPVEEGPSTTGLVGMLTSQHPRVNPRRRFVPGETYEPQDLNPFTPRSPGRIRPNAGLARRPSAEEVMEKADYKNVAFLSRWFLSPAGRLLARRQTRLPVNVHKFVSRQVKLARHMGLMAGEARLDKLHLGQLREQELLDAQRRAAAAAAVTAAAGDAAAAARGDGSRGARVQQLAELGA